MDINYIDIMNQLDTKQMILQGPPGTSKTFTAKQIVAQALGYSGKADQKEIAECLKKNADRWEMVQFHPSYGYEDFVRGITVETNKENQIVYKTVNKIFGEMCKRAYEDENKDNQYFLIIDEINRADVATVFGELIYALEYRGEEIVIPYQLDEVDWGRKLVVPKNLYIIATMNTADKSVGNIDYAIRRRFVFFDCPADEKVLRSYYGLKETEEPNESITLFRGVREFLKGKLKTGEYREEDFQIGHTYFMAAPGEEQEYKLRYQVLPILREYYIDGILKRNEIENDEQYLCKYLSGKVQLNDELFVKIKNEFIELGDNKEDSKGQ